MSARRSRRIVSSDDEFETAAPRKGSDSGGSEPEFEEEADDFDDLEDEDHQPLDAEDSAEDAEDYEPEIVRPLRSGRPQRETKKRQLTFYEEDDLPESDEEAPPPKKRVSVKLKIPRRAPKKEDDFLEPEPEYRPDVLRMTERQRARLADDDGERYEELMFARMDEQLLALNRKTQKKQETAEEIAVRKAENARKRADYKTKQLEEEKRDTLNKLLKRRANKTREKEDEEDEPKTLKPRRPVVGHPGLVRWVSLATGSVLAYAE